MSRKVLIITTHFPPDRHVGARRPAKFAKYLPQYGWEALILTIPSRELRDGVDESLLEDLPKELKIYRVPGWTNSTGMNGNRIKKEEKLFSKFRTGFGGLLLPHYKVRWIVNSITEGIRIVENEKIDLIFSTVPDPEAYITAFFISIFKGKKFVCDFRDPSPWMWDWELSLENIIMMFFQGLAQWKADAVVSISKVLRKRLIGKGWPTNGKKYITIYNGFDEDDFKGIGQKSDNLKSSFTITFVGSWGQQRDPKHFLEAIEILLLNNPTLQGEIKVIFVGWVKRDPTMEKWLGERLGKGVLSKTVELKPFLPYREALSEMKRADVLLTCNSEKIVRGGALESKLFEYLYTGNPILALSATNCDLSHFLQDMAAGIVVPSTKPKLIARAIFDMYEKYSKGLSHGASHDCVKQFERMQLTERLAKLFDAVMTRQKNLITIGW